PATSRTYRLTVNGPCGTVTQDVAITVIQSPSITSFTASVNPVCSGSSTTLTWASSGGTSASVTDLTSGTVTAVPVNGSLSVTPASTRTYRLTATNGCNSVVQDITITVTQTPVISSFTASASPVCSGGSSTLSWSAAGGTSATISAPGLPGSPVSVNPN